MFERLKSWRTRNEAEIVSLTRYFEDTVRQIARSNLRQKMLEDQPIDDDMLDPHYVGTMLLLGGQEVARCSMMNDDEIAPRLNLEEGLLRICDASRRAYGLKQGKVYYVPNELAKNMPAALDAIATDLPMVVHNQPRPTIFM